MTDAHPDWTPSHIVGIGASAGGLDALERFFDNLPKDTGMAFVVVQHLSPDFKSLMDELLARHTALPIHLVEDGMPVEADHVYLIPRKKEMIISNGRLLLSEADRQQELTLPIDVFFRSLAQDCGSRAVAIVLSGSGSDGSRGVRDVFDAGGLVIVQDTHSAQFDGMPKTARDAGVAQWVLAPDEMPRILLEHVAKRAHSRTSELDTGSVEAQGLDVVYQMLQQEFGIDFTNYKPSTVTRRIERRLALARSQDVHEYVKRLKSEHAELDALYQDLLIGVTRFFRDEQAFAVLEQRILPELLQQGSRETPLRLWVAGCATGEEAYSLAIVLQDLMATLGERPVKIFATDVHRGSLERATRGIYGEQSVASVSPARLARYFLRNGDEYQVVPDLRQMVVFARHNVIKDAPFTRVDLIACRNLLIYLQPVAQQKAFSLFHFALNRGGVLFLGPSESAAPLAWGFETIDKHWRLYRKHSDARMAIDTRMQPAVRPDVRAPSTTTQPPGARHSLAQLLATYEALLSDVMPPSLLVNERNELIHAFAGASRFLRMRDGRQRLDVLELVDPELKLLLVGALKRASNETSPIVYKSIRIAEANGVVGMHKVTVRRVPGRGEAAPYTLISFESTGEAAPRAEHIEIEIDQGSHEQLRALEAELSHTKESLQSTVEELEASNEELQASNEELQASNEELQSTNEELQSVNEELYTVNAEYQRKIAELTELTNDMDNLLSSTDVGTIFLDSQLRIRKFTSQIAETFRLVPHDIGRSIETFAHHMNDEALVEDLKLVLSSGQPVERELRDFAGKAFFLRMLPYRVKGSPDGVVLTMIDVSGLKAAEDALFHERYLLNSLLANIPDAIYFKDARGRFIRANHAMATRLGLQDAVAAVGKTAFELPDQAVGLALHAADEAMLRDGKAQHYKLERHVGIDSEAWDLVTRLPLHDRTNRIVGVAAIFRDVTEQKRAEQKIREAVQRRDQFLAMLSHELRNPLGAIVTATAVLKSSGVTRDPDKFVRVVERQSQQMARLLDDLLEASRVTQNKIELKKKVVDVNAVAGDAADAVRDQMDSCGIHFSVETDPGPLYIEADPARMQQIQVNLLNNAAKYTQRDGRVLLAVQRDGEDAVIRVRDDGAGIPPDMIDSVFDLFVQSTRTLDRAAGGLGVGLTLVRSLVAMHGGTVTARSDGEGKGSEFVVRLPLSHAPGDGKSEEPPHRSRPPIRGRAKVIVVEDSPDSRELLCEVLQDAGFECLAAENGTTALALIEKASPHIAILDVGLPEMDGLELARRLRAHPKHADIRLIALTGYGRASDRAVALNAGFDEHLVKPVEMDDLLKLLSEMLEAGGAAAIGKVAGAVLPETADAIAVDTPDGA